MEFRRHYFVLPSQKVNILKNQLFLDPENRGGHSQPLSSRLERQIGMRMESRLTRTETHSGNHLRNQCWGKKTTDVTDELLNALCIQLWKLVSWGTQSYGDPHSILRLNPRSSPRFHSKYWRKILFPSCFYWEEQGKKISWNILEYSVLFRACPQGKLVN